MIACDDPDAACAVLPRVEYTLLHFLQKIHHPRLPQQHHEVRPSLLAPAPTVVQLVATVRVVEALSNDLPAVLGGVPRLPAIVGNISALVSPDRIHDRLMENDVDHVRKRSAVKWSGDLSAKNPIPQLGFLVSQETPLESWLGSCNCI